MQSTLAIRLPFQQHALSIEQHPTGYGRAADSDCTRQNSFTYESAALQKPRGGQNQLTLIIQDPVFTVERN